MSELKAILTADEWKDRQKTSPETKWPTRRNVALNKGGSVDIYTSAGSEVVAVLRYVPLNAEREREINKLLDQALRKACAAAEAATAQPAAPEPKN